MNQQELWDLFKSTGNLDIYLKYKQLQRLEHEDVEEYKPCVGH